MSFGTDNQLVSTPINAQRTLRRDETRVLTSGDAGKVLPIAAIPLLREDAVQRAQMRILLEMQETAETLLNAVHANVHAYFVPYLAFERFTGMDSLNRSYMGEKERPTDEEPIPFVETAAFGNPEDRPIYKTMGLHARSDTQVNTALVEAYNTMVNFRRRQRSQSLPLRDRLDYTLAEAFWHHTHMQHIVPDFDQARIDGEVPLSIVDQALPVRGIGLGTPTSGSYSFETSVLKDTVDPTGTARRHTGMGASQMNAVVEVDGENIPQVFAEMQDQGITISLANIELARKTAAFARLRERYQGHDDEFIIDMLMQGLRVPEAALSQPMLLAHRHTIFGYSKRWATDADNLDKSVTNGTAVVDLSLRTPPMNTGGIIIVTVEITPEQMFERQKDYFLHANSVDDFPHFLRDYLDPEKVSVVTNDHVDIDHDTPNALFGYAPLNHQWQRTAPRIGGKFYRPEVDQSFDEDRQRIWSAETENPELTADFYLVTDLHKKVFADTLADSFEIVATGGALISGLTVFGARLTEASDDYEKIMGQVDLTRIEKE